MDVSSKELHDFIIAWQHTYYHRYDLPTFLDLFNIAYKIEDPISDRLITILHTIETQFNIMVASGASIEDRVKGVAAKLAEANQSLVALDGLLIAAKDDTALANNKILSIEQLVGNIETQFNIPRAALLNDRVLAIGNKLAAVNTSFQNLQQTLTATQGQLADSNGKITSVEGVLTAIEAQFNITKASTLNNRVSAVASALLAANNSCSSLDGLLNAANSKLTTAEQLVTNLETAFNVPHTTSVPLADRISALANAINGPAATLAGFLTTIEPLYNLPSTGSINARVAALTDKLRIATENLIQVQDMLDTANSYLGDTAGEVNTLQEQLLAAGNRVYALEEMLAQLESQFNITGGGTLEDRVTVVGNALATARQAVQTLEGELEIANAAVSVKSATITSYEDRITGIEDQLVDLELRFNITAAGEIEDRIGTLADKLDTTIASLTTQLDVANDRVTAAENILTNIETEFNITRAGTLNDRIYAVQEALNAARVNANTLQALLTTANTTISTATTTVVGLETQFGVTASGTLSQRISTVAAAINQPTIALTSAISAGETQFGITNPTGTLVQRLNALLTKVAATNAGNDKSVKGIQALGSDVASFVGPYSTSYGGQKTFQLRFTPEDAANKKIYWTTGEPLVISVPAVTTGNSVTLTFWNGCNPTYVTGTTEDGGYKVVLYGRSNWF
jgi:chromosome segregation ATPase